MEREKNLIDWMQKWYFSYCDGDWEHDERFVIRNIDNPGWRVSINLKGTHCEMRDLPLVKIEKSEEDWYHCFTKNEHFEGAGGPHNLNDILNFFKNWAEKSEQS